MYGKSFGKWFGILALVAAGALLFNLSSCARDQELTAISVTPAIENFGSSSTPVMDDQGANVQLRALGFYNHPSVTKDITDQVTWTSNTPELATVSATGLLTATGQACGGSLISATSQTNASTGGRSSSGAIVTGYMTANVICFSGGSGSGPALTVQFDTDNGLASGTVTSNPTGLNCTSLCAADFPSGTPLTLTATPGTGSSFFSWTGCQSQPNVNPCTLTLTENTTVTVTFSP
jgi:hypothetical protein